MVSEAYVGLTKAAAAWDARKGPFPQYARLKVGFHLLSYVRDHAAPVKRRAHQRGEQPIKLVELLEATAGASEEPDPDEIAELMVGLPVRERRILELHYLEDLTLTQIAAQQNLSLARVSQLEQRALQQLREKLSEHGGFPLRARQGTKLKPGMLTERQAVVLAHAAQGLTPEQSAKRLGLHPQTVREHRRAAKRRLGGKGTYLTNTVYIATRQGLID